MKTWALQTVLFRESCKSLYYTQAGLGTASLPPPLGPALGLTISFPWPHLPVPPVACCYLQLVKDVTAHGHAHASSQSSLAASRETRARFRPQNPSKVSLPVLQLQVLSTIHCTIIHDS